MFIIQAIFLITSLNGYMLYVPECYSSLQHAVFSASDGDIVSVNFGRVNGTRTIVANSSVFGKQLTFEIRGRGKEQLLEMIKDMISFPKTDSRVPQYPDSGWQGQKWICRPDSSPDYQPCIAFDSSGCAWVVWWGYALPNYSQLFTKWNGIGWNEEKGVGPNDSGLVARVRPRICFDNENIAWLVWDNFYANNNNDIAFSCFQDTCWSPEVQVNLPDSTDLDFMPKIACGGGEKWCVWYGGPTDVSPYTVYASRWNGSNWEPEMQVSPSDSMQHWFCDITVDDNGRPHVVWSEYPHYWLYYSYYDVNQSRWTEPVIVNDADTVMTAPWSYAAIAIDRESNLHVSWTGAYIGAETRDIFYNKCVGSQWLPTVKISQDSGCQESRSDIGVDLPYNIWIAYDREIGAADGYVYVTCFNGSNWSDEERIDNNDSYWDIAPVVNLDRSGYPWVCYYGYPNYFPRCDVFYNRYVGNQNVEEKAVPLLRIPSFLKSLSSLFHSYLKISYGIPKQSYVELKIYSLYGSCVQTLVRGYKTVGEYETYWNGKDINNKKVPAGIYLCRLRIGKETEVKTITKIK